MGKHRLFQGCSQIWGKSVAEHRSDKTAKDAEISEADALPSASLDGALEPAKAADGAVTDTDAPVEEPENGEDANEDDVEYVEENVVVIRRRAFVLLAAAAALLIVALAAANVYQAVRPAPAVAKVNGVAISRKDYDKAVAQDGQQVLDNLINDRLVKQDAAKKHVSVSTDEVDAKLKEIKGQIGTEEQYKQALSAQHITELSLRDSIRNFLLLQKLTADRNQVSDADVQTAYSQGKDTEYPGKSLDDVKDQIKSQLTQDKQQQAQSSYLDDLKKNAKISLHIPGA